MIFYSWTAFSENSRSAPDESGQSGPRGGSGAGEPPVAMGISDDRGRAMRAGAETLGSGRAAVVIVEAVRPAMVVGTLAPGYVRTGVSWVGRCTRTGEVAWRRIWLRAGPDGQRAAGRMRP
jgi:hypothetical protein